MSVHGVLGYVVAGLATVGFVLALAALLSRSRTLDRLMYACFVLCALIQLPALVTGVIDNAAFATTAAVVAPYNFFVGASFFTLTGILVVWRGANPVVVWDSRRWLMYQATALGNVLLSVTLICLGQLARTGG